MQSFPPFPFYSFQRNRLCHLFPLSLSLSLTPNYFWVQLACIVFCPHIPAGDCSWRGKGGQGLTLGSMICVCLCFCAVCVSRLLCYTFKFPQLRVNACHLGGKAGSPQYKEQSKHKLRISAASNWCTISPCRSRQPAVEWIENSLWWFPLLRWHSFTP